MKSYSINNVTMVGLMVLCFWMVILFLDGSFSRTQIVEQPLVLPQITGQTMMADSSQIDLDSGVAQKVMGNSQAFQDLGVLEYLYTKNKNPDLLQPLIEKFLQYYQFEKANTYLELLVQNEGDYFKLQLDPRQVLYALSHASRVGLDSPNSLDSVVALAQQYRSRDMITQDDLLMYQGLKSLWIYDYSGATASFGKIVDSRYQDFKASYESSLANFVKIKNPPTYYRDGLVSLTLLRNGYFSSAKRLALHALMLDKEYVLPYQVLAYANFLTHNWETAKEYFLKLASFDTKNSVLYTFLIGVSYYRYGDYDQSILYLNQVSNPALQADAYRYMLLSYIQSEDDVGMVRMRQNILGQPDLQPSDFSLFFDQWIYIPFRSGKPFTLYTQNPQLADMYLAKCSSLFTGSQADVCMYGEVALQLAKQNLSGMGQKLLALTTTYHQSHLYHVLGDYYAGLKQYDLAKQYYAKALSVCDTTVEQAILKNKISKLN